MSGLSKIVTDNIFCTLNATLNRKMCIVNLFKLCQDTFFYIRLSVFMKSSLTFREIICHSMINHVLYFDRLRSYYISLLFSAGFEPQTNWPFLGVAPWLSGLERRHLTKGLGFELFPLFHDYYALTIVPGSS